MAAKQYAWKLYLDSVIAYTITNMNVIVCKYCNPNPTSNICRICLVTKCH